MIHKLNSQSVCRKSLEFIRDPVCYNKKCNILHISDLFLSYFLDTTQSRRRRDNADGEFDDISLDNRPELEFTCKFNRNITVDDDLNVNELSETTESLTQSGILEYTAAVNDVRIGRDQYTEVVITPNHNLVGVYAV